MPNDVVIVRLEGGEELLAALRAVDANVKSVLRAATLMGAEIIAGAANAMAPAPNIETEVVSATAGAVEVAIGPDDEHWYYRFFEQGAAAHEIESSPLVFDGRDGLVVTARVSHTGMPARPFLRPAHDERSDDAKDEMGARLRAAAESAGRG